MNTLLVLFAENLLPIFLAAGAGFVVSRQFKPNPRPLSQVIFYIFTPALVFTLVMESQLSGGEILRMMGFAASMILLIGALTLLAGRALHLERRMLAAVVITSMFMNAGNFGLSINLFAFGESALAFASLFFVTSVILTYTAGVMIASMGSASFTQALANLARVPTLYALVIAFIFLRMGWELPLAVNRTVNLLSDATIPSMLVLLGVQLSNVQWKGSLVPLALTNSMRLLVGPLLALGLSLVFGLQGAARQAGILEAAMPTAVMATVLAVEYDVEPAFVTAAVFVSTLASALTLTPLLAYLGG